MFGGGRQESQSWLGSQAPESQRALPPVPDWAPTPAVAAAALSRFAPAASAARSARPQVQAQPWFSQSQASLVTPARSSLTGGPASQQHRAPPPPQHAPAPPAFALAQPLPWESAVAEGRRDGRAIATAAERRFGHVRQEQQSFASTYASQPPVVKPPTAPGATAASTRPASAPAAAAAAAFAALNATAVEDRLAAIEASCAATQASVTSLAMALEALAASHRVDAGAGTLTAEALQALQRAVMQLLEQHASTARLAATCTPAAAAAPGGGSGAAARGPGAAAGIACAAAARGVSGSGSGSASRAAPSAAPAASAPKAPVRASKRQRRAVRRFAEEADEADVADAAEDEHMPLASSAAASLPMAAWPLPGCGECRDDPFAFLTEGGGEGVAPAPAAHAAAPPTQPLRATPAPPMAGALVPWAWAQAAPPAPVPPVPLRTVAVVLPPVGGGEAHAARSGGAPWRKLRREAPAACAAAAREE